MYIQECENLARENAAISGHQNLRQKIHYHASTKLENSKLKEVRAMASRYPIYLERAWTHLSIVFLMAYTTLAPSPSIIMHSSKPNFFPIFSN